MFIRNCSLYIRLLVLLLPAVLFANINCKAQASSSNFVRVNTNTSIYFLLSNAAQIESAQTITNAFCLYTKTSANNASYYVKATNSTTTTTSMPIGNLVLTFYSTDAVSGRYSNLNTSAIPLTTSDQLLFQVYKKNTFYNFCYSVGIPATGYTYKPGIYSWTITFTMTQP